MSAAFGLLTTREIVHFYGASAYATFGLLTSLGALLPFADLGVSAAVVNVVAKYGRAKHCTEPTGVAQLEATLVSAIRATVLAGVAIATLGLIVTLAGAWPSLLGRGLSADGSDAAAACLFLFAVGIPLGLGQRVLLGLGKNHVQILVASLQAPLTLALLFSFRDLKLRNTSLPAAAWYLSALLVLALQATISVRILRPSLGRAIAASPHFRTVRGVSIRDTAWPMLVQMIALPVALQSDRLVLSHTANAAALAQYSLAFQLFNPAIAALAAGALALWPHYARSSEQTLRAGPLRMAKTFAAIGLVISVSLILVRDPITSLASGGAIRLPLPLLFAFSGLMIANAVKYPLGMSMTNAQGLKAQVVPIIIMAPVNLALSIVSVGPLGACGPIAVSAACVCVFQVFPCARYVLSRPTIGDPHDPGTRVVAT